MARTSTLRLVSSENPPRPSWPDDLDDDEILDWSLPAGVADDLSKNLGNPSPATPATRPLPGQTDAQIGRPAAIPATLAGSVADTASAIAAMRSNGLKGVQLPASPVNDLETGPDNRGLLRRIADALVAPFDHFNSVCQDREGCRCAACEVGAKSSKS